MPESSDISGYNECERNIGITSQTIQLVEYHSGTLAIDPQTGKRCFRVAEGKVNKNEFSYAEIKRINQSKYTWKNINRIRCNCKWW